MNERMYFAKVWARRVPFWFAALQVVGFAACAIAIQKSSQTNENRTEEIVGTMVVATIAAQLTLLSAAAALGPGKLLRRWAWCGAIIGGEGTLLGIAIVWGREPLVTAPWGIVPMSIVWSILQIPFWITRLCCGARVGLPALDGEPQAMIRIRFGVRHLMWLTLVVCLVLGLARWIIPEHVLHAYRPPAWRDAACGALMFSAMTLIGLTTTLMPLHPRLWLWGVGVSLVSTTSAAWGTYWLVASMRLAPDEPSAFVIGLTTTYAWLLASVMLLRFSGYRLLMSDKAPPG